MVGWALVLWAAPSPFKQAPLMWPKHVKSPRKRHNIGGMTEETLEGQPAPFFHR